MGATLVGHDAADATTITIPTHQAGDLIIICALKWGSTSPTPTVPSGWTSKTSATNTYRRVVGVRVATGPGTTSGTWTSAASLWVIVLRGVTAGAVASAVASGTNVATPALTLTSAPSEVLALGNPHSSGIPAIPSGMVDFASAPSGWDYRYRWSITPSPVSSWSQVSGVTNQEIAVAVELIATTVDVDGSVTLRGAVRQAVEGSVALRASVAGYLGGTVTLRGRVLVRVDGSLALRGRVLVRVQGSAALRGRVRQRVEGSVTLSGQIEALGTWRELIRTERWRQAIAAPDRTVSCRVQLVDLAHRPVSVPSRWGDLLEHLPATAVEVSRSAETSPSWTCSLTLTDPRWVPGADITHPLHPLAPYRVAIWWRLLLARGVWGEVPMGVYTMSEPRVSDEGGKLTITAKGEDVVGDALAGGYAGVVDVGGLTVDAALRRLFEQVAPSVPFETEASSATLPAVYELGRRKPVEDWTDIAAMDGMVIRADRDGVLRAARPASTDSGLRLIEGPDCQMSSLDMQLGGSMYNRVVVRSTHPDLTEPVWGMDEDDDPASPTYVGVRLRQLDIDTDVATTADACIAMARLHRARFRRPAEKLSVRIRPRPDIDPGDQGDVLRQRAGVAGVYQVQSWRIPMPIDGVEPGPMELVFDSQQQRGE